jgi:hypothetical protein
LLLELIEGGNEAKPLALIRKKSSKVKAPPRTVAGKRRRSVAKWSQ